LPSLQSDFRPGHSTETDTLRLLSDTLEAVDSGDVAALVLLDLSAAFDTVDHVILCRRLVSYASVPCVGVVSVRGATLFQKVRVPFFVSFGSLGPRWIAAIVLASPPEKGLGCCGTGGEGAFLINFSLLTDEKAHFGGYLMRSDVVILKLWFAVHRTGCYKVVRPILSAFLPTGCSSSDWG